MVQEFSSSTKNEDTLVSQIWGINWRQRIRPKNKLRMNMKVVLDLKFQKVAATIVEYSSINEYLQVVDVKHHIVDQTIEHHIVNQTLEEIEKELEHALELREEGYKDKGKQKIYVSKMETCSNLSNVKELEEQENPTDQAVTETLS